MSGFERVAAGLIGAAFGLKIFDAKKPLWARVAYGAVSFDLVTMALKPAVEHPLLGDPKARLADARSKLDSKFPAQHRTTTGPAVSVLHRTETKFVEKRVRTIQERVAHVHLQMIQGTRDPKIYTLAREIVAKKCGDGFCIPEKDAKAEITALFDEVRKRVRYTWDPTDYDAFQTPSKTLALKAGDCDDYVSLLGALCRTIGHQVRSRIVQTKGESTWNHIYLMAKVGDGWMPLDASMKQPAGWEVPKSAVIRKQDFDVVESGAGPQLDK